MEILIIVTTDRGDASSLAFWQWAGGEPRPKLMSTSRSNLLFSENARLGLESLSSFHSAAERKTAPGFAPGKSGECASNKRCAQRGGPLDHGIMIARPRLKVGAQGKIRYGKQNVNRRHPPGRDQGGGDSRQSG